MKRLSLLCSLVVVFAVGTAHAQQYEVAPSGTKAFTTHEGLFPGGTISLDIWLTGVAAPQHAGGAWIDFSASTDDLSYLDAGIASPPCRCPNSLAVQSRRSNWELSIRGSLGSQTISALWHFLR